MEYYYPGMVNEISWDKTKIFLIILVLALFGINIFQYLANTTDILIKLGLKSAETSVDITKNILKRSGEGAKLGIDIAEGTLSRGINTLEEVLIKNPKLENVHGRQIPKADISESEIQKPKKSGYCYIGNENGNRACVKVGVNDTCMSGDIFPSRDICMNPNLRV